MLVVEATGIRDVPSGPLLRIGHDRFVPGLARLVEAVRAPRAAARRGSSSRSSTSSRSGAARRPRPSSAASSRSRDALRRGPRRARRPATCVGGAPRRPCARGSSPPDARRSRRSSTRASSRRSTAAATASASPTSTCRTCATCRASLPGLFADAAERARDARASTASSSTTRTRTRWRRSSRARTTRADGYGGSLEGRLRLPLEVIAAVRARVGASFAVGVRFLGDEVIEGGSRIDDAAPIGVAFARAGLDFLSISKGGKFEDAQAAHGRRGGLPVHRARAATSACRRCAPTRAARSGATCRSPRAIRAPCARRASRRRSSPRAASPRSSRPRPIARRAATPTSSPPRASRSPTPTGSQKMRLGRGAEVRRCEFTNYCEALDQKHKQVTCKLWDRDFDAADASVTRSTRRPPPPRRAAVDAAPVKGP